MANSCARSIQPLWNAISLRDELLDGEIFYTLKEAQIMIET